MYAYNFDNSFLFQLRSVDGKVYRSLECYGLVRRSGRTCRNCSAAKYSVVNFINRLRHERRLCRGIAPEPYAQLIEARKWRTDRRDASFVDFSSNRLFGRKCNGIKEKSSQRRCFACQTTASAMTGMIWRAKNKPAISEETRLIKSGIKRLSATDRLAKAKLLKRGRDERREKMRAQLKKLKLELQRVEKFVPKDMENRAAVQNLVTHLDRETERVKRPICRWAIGEDQCGHVASSCLRLLTHVVNVHISQQRDVNRQSEIAPADRRYVCKWNNCSRRSPFRNWNLIFRHAKDHTGSIENVQRLDILRNQLINSSKSKTGRRYCEAAKLVGLAHYRSRKSWELACSYSPLPIIGGRSIRKIKNGGRVTSGIDAETLATMDRIAQNKPYLRHGILVFDEVSIYSRFSCLSA